MCDCEKKGRVTIQRIRQGKCPAQQERESEKVVLSNERMIKCKRLKMVFLL